jgi:hypothetical protein
MFLSLNTMDHGVIWSNRKNGAMMIVSPDGMLILVLSYPGKPRCITPIILHFYFMVVH